MFIGVRKSPSEIGRPKYCRRRHDPSPRLEQLEHRDVPSVLVWSDEFDRPEGSAPDPAKWGYDLGGGGWGNAELQVYTNSTQNASITADPEATDGKALAIRAIQTGTNSYTSARLKTKDILSWTYGRFEARLQLPFGQGIWPAFWMLGSNIDSAGWPNCGEIDVMENIGREPSIVHGTLHGPGYSGGNGIGAGYTLPGGQKFSDAYHTFAIEWSPNTIRWYVDDQLYQTRTPADLPAGTTWVYDHNFFMILNLAVGGQWPGNPDSSTVFPQTYLVDYVRVYQESPPDPRNVSINFQTSDSQGYAGYLADTGLAFADRGNGYSYGWNVDNTANARNRNAANAPDERYDTFNHMQKAGGASVWEIAVPNGTYNIHVVAGDPSFIDSVNHLNLEGTVVTDPDGNDNFDEYNTVVTVTDGRLTITPAAGAVNAKLAFIDITSAPSDTTPPTVTSRTPDNGATVTAASVNIDVTFSESVVGVDATDLVLTGAGAAGAVKSAPVNLGGNTWRFPVSGLVSGNVNVALAPDANDIEDTAGNDLAPVLWLFISNRQTNFVVTTSGDLRTTETGLTAAITVVLTSQPTSDVTIPVNSSDSSEGTASTSQLIFTPNNWNLPQTITITGQPEAGADGNVAYTIDLGPSTSLDLNYNSLPTQSVEVTNFDSAPVDKVGIFRSLTQRWTLDTFNDGVYTAGQDTRYTLLGGGKTIVGDWDGDGYDDIGLFRPLSGKFLLFVDGNLFKTFTMLDGKVGGVPLVGNWNGLPGDEVGLFRPFTGTFILDFDGDGVSSDADDRIGAMLDGKAYGKPLVGDWDGIGGEEVGLYRTGTGVFTLDRDLDLVSRDADDTVITRLAGRVGGQALVGDWDGDGDDDIGLYLSLSGQWLLDTNGSALAAERTITRLDGAVGGKAIVGDFNGDGFTDCGIFRPLSGKWTIDLNRDGVFTTGTDLQYLKVDGGVGGAPLVGKWELP